MNELKVGFLTLLAITSLVVVSVKITGSKKGFGEYVEYKTILNDASGIYEESSIKVAGIVAGKIRNVSLSGSQALVTFEVTDKIKITSFSKLRIKTVGFLGDKYVDIYLGNPDAPRLKEGSFIEAAGGAGFEELGKDASEILKDVKAITANLREALYNDKNESVIKSIVNNVNEITQNTKSVSDSLRRLVNGNESKLQKVIEDLEAISSQLAYETDRYSEGSLMNDLDELKPILNDAKQTMADISSIVGDVKDGKGTVGKLLRDEEVIDQVNETLSGVNRLVNRVNNFKTDIIVFSGTSDGMGPRTALDIDLIPAPERFFRAGFVFTDYGRLISEEETRELTSGGSTTVTEEKITDSSGFKFNVQIGRRVGNFVFRVGILESTGGFGVDYNVNSNFSFGTEIFDFNEDLGPYTRLYADIRLWNILYARISGEELTGKESDPFAAVSLGLKFSDEDLASLIGLVGF